MDVRVLICWHPGNLFHASVMTLDVARIWNKIYPSKLVCAIDLLQIGLVTIMDQDDVLNSDFDTKDKILMTHTGVETGVLEEAGFVELIVESLIASLQSSCGHCAYHWNKAL